MSTDRRNKDAAPPPAANPESDASEGAESFKPETAANPEERIAALEAEVADLRDRWMRAEAEIANVRARGRREVDETRQYAVQKFAKDVVEAAENLRRGIDSLPAASKGEPEIVSSLREGFAGVERSLLSVLERNGIKREDPVGQPFDPNFHQAMAEQESASHPAGSIMQAWTPAWTLNGRLLRPAMVVVSKGAPVHAAHPAFDKTG